MKTASGDTVTAFKYATAISVPYVLIPALFGLIDGIPDIADTLVLRVLSGIFIFLIVFLASLVWLKTKKNKNHEKENAPMVNSKFWSSKLWNVIMLIAGLLMFFGMFLPDMLDGTLQSIYYLGAIFWVVVIWYSSKNLIRMHLK